MEIKKQVFQSALLFSSMLGAMVFNFFGSVLITKILGPISYGDLKFIQTLWMLFALLSTFGFLQSGSRILLLEKDENQTKQIVSVILLLALIMGFFLALFIAIIAYPIDLIFHTDVFFIILVTAPLVIGITLRDTMLLILQSTNQITLLAGLNIFPGLFNLIGLYILSKITIINTGITLAIQQLSLIFVILVIIIIIRPRSGSFRYYWQNIREENKEFGFHIYTGSIAAVATTYINRLALSYWVDNTALGFYSLASSLTEPLRLMPNAAATSFYKTFSNRKFISKKIFLITIMSSIFSLAGAYVFFGKPLTALYSKDFSSVGHIARIISIAAIAFGFGDFLNKFLSSHGEGKKIRNAAYISGAVNVLGSFFLLPFIGINGAMITSLLAGFSYLTSIYLYYRRFKINVINTEF